MYPIGVVGPGSDRLAERLVEHLATRASVGAITDRDQPVHDGNPGRPDGTRRSRGSALVAGDAPARHRATGADAAYAFDGDGWYGAGNGDLRDVLDRLATDCEFAVVSGFADARLPQIVLDGVEHAGPTLLESTDPNTVDPDDAVEAATACEPYETLESLVRRIKNAPEAPQAGAIATFTGRVRARDAPNDTPTECLEFEKYGSAAAERLATIDADLEAREGVHQVLIHHRSGRIDYGEDIVFVVVLAGHRGEAFRTVEDGIDRLKAEVPIFKKEVTIDEEFWVHDRA